MQRRLRHNDLEGRSHVTAHQMPGTGGSIAASEHDMRMDAGSAIRADGDVADQCGNLHLLVDGYRLVRLRLPIEVGNVCSPERTDGCHLRPTDCLVPGERLEACYGFVSGVENDSERPETAAFMKQFDPHRVSFPDMWSGSPAAGSRVHVGRCLMPTKSAIPATDLVIGQRRSVPPVPAGGIRNCRRWHGQLGAFVESAACRAASAVVASSNAIAVGALGAVSGASWRWQAAAWSGDT